MARPPDPYYAAPPFGEGGQPDPDLQNQAPQRIDADLPDDAEPPDDLQNWSQEQQGPQWYPETTLDVRYEMDPGTYAAVPSGPDGTPCETLKLRAARWTKVVSFTFERLHDWPAIPSFITNNPDLQLDYVSIQPAMPKRVLDGVKVYRIAGLYKFTLLKGFQVSSVSGPSASAILHTSKDPANNDAATMGGFPLVRMDPTMLPSG